VNTNRYEHKQRARLLPYSTTIELTVWLLFSNKVQFSSVQFSGNALVSNLD